MLTEGHYPSTSTLSETLPPYVIASPPPCYSSDPACGEQRIEHSPRSHVSRVASGTFIKKNGSVTVVFTDQEENIATPSYGRQGKINGAILLDKHESVAQVKVKLMGNLDYLNSDGGAKSIPLVDQSVILWTSARGPCPGQIPFAFTLPATFTNDDKNQPLPPSFVSSGLGGPGVVVTSVYTILVHVSYTRRNVGLFSKSKIIRIPLNYNPRTRPNRPILPIPLLCGLKSSPEEWTQSMTTMKTKINMDVEAIQSNTFIPSVQVFALSDCIPIHVQLTGSLTSLRQFFPEGSSSTTASSSSSTPSVSRSTPPVTVSILRQISVDVRGHRSWRNATIGEGKIWPVPPTASQLENYPSEGEVLDWEGEIQAKSDVTVGGFAAAGVVVKDFIVVSLTPPQNSPFLPTQTHIPIRLVTDTWIDAPDRA